MSTSEVRVFDPVAYKSTIREQWQTTAEAWHRWGPTLEAWLGHATQAMLDMAGVKGRARVLDVAAGAGGQTIAAAERVGPSGTVLATDISPVILEYAEAEASTAGLSNVTTRVMDGEELEVEPGSFDAVISRLGLTYFPDQRKALGDMRRASARRRTGRGHRLLDARTQSVQLDPDVDHQATCWATAAAPRTARAVQPRGNEPQLTLANMGLAIVNAFGGVPPAPPPQ